MKHFFYMLLTAFVLFSCGSKTSNSTASAIKETNAYIAKVDANSALMKETTEGALADAAGFNDIGTFKYSVFFDKETKALHKIKNIEMTTSTLSETYYYDADNLVAIDISTDGKTNRIYIQKNKFISENKLDSATEKLLIEKAKRFQKAYQKGH